MKKKTKIGIGIAICLFIFAILLFASAPIGEALRVGKCESSCEEIGHAFYGYINEGCYCDDPKSNVSLMYRDEK